MNDIPNYIKEYLVDRLSLLFPTHIKDIYYGFSIEIEIYYDLLFWFNQYPKINIKQFRGISINFHKLGDCKDERGYIRFHIEKIDTTWKSWFIIEESI